MTAPAVIIFLAMFIAPMILAFILSLTDWNGFSLNLNFVAIKNYEEAFKNPRTTDAAIFTAILAIVGTLFCNGLGLLMAVLISGPGKLNTIARTIFFYPYIISSLIIGFLWSALLAPRGVINNVLTQIGIDPLPFLTDPNAAKASVIFTIIWSHYGFNMILYIAGLKSIPAEYTEAAIVDGAGPLARFRKITIPLLATVVTVNLVLTLVGLLRVYDVILSLTDGGPAAKTQTIVYQILNESFINNKLGLGAAQSIVLLVITAIIGFGITLARRGAEKKVSE